ncbi:MAG: hypothetical protein ACJ782_19285 [Actinomycetota bacterium]
MSDAERQQLREVLCSPRFVDVAPAEIVATLLDEGVWLASERTMYRLLAEHGQTIRACLVNSRSGWSPPTAQR